MNPYTLQDFVERDPLSALKAALRRELEMRRIESIRPQAGVLDDDGVFDIPIEIALTPYGLLPMIVDAGRLVFAEAWFDKAAGQYPFVVEPQQDAMLGLGVRVAIGQAYARPEIGLACVVDALCSLIDRAQETSGEDLKQGILPL